MESQATVLLVPPGELVVWPAARKGHEQGGMRENRRLKPDGLPCRKWISVRGACMARARRNPGGRRDRGGPPRRRVLAKLP